MKSGLPPLNWLRAFEASARHLSFTDAAAELNLTQAAISKQVKSLELHLRQQLFIRRPRSLELTKTAEAYLPKVRDAFDRLAIGTNEVFGQRRNEVLTVRCAVSFAVNWLSPRLPDFLANHPGTQIRILSSVWSDAFDKDLFDLDIQYGTGAWPGFDSHRLTSEHLMPLCAPERVGTLQSPQDLCHHTIIHVLGYQEGWGLWLKAAGVTSVGPGQGLLMDTSLAAFEVAASGGGVALGRSSLAEKDLSCGRLAAPFDLAVPIDEAFYLLRSSGGSSHPDEASFTTWLLAQSGTART